MCRLDRMVQGQVMEQDEVHGDVGGHVMMVIKLQTWKRRKRTKWLKAKLYLIGTFCFATQDTKWV